MPVAKKVAKRQVERHRHCPSCYNGLGGVGNVYTTHQTSRGKKQYLRCQSCGHTWTAIVLWETKTIEVTSRTVELETRNQGDITNPSKPANDN